MLKTGDGSIVNLASIAGLNCIHHGWPLRLPTKHAVVGLTSSPGALDYATQNIRIGLQVAQAAIQTDIIVRQLELGQ